MMEIFKNITTVFVDLDDTIWWFSKNSLQSLRHVFDQFGIGKFCDYETFGMHYHYINSHLWNEYHHGRIPKEVLVNERFRYALEKSGCPTGAIDGKAMNSEYLDFLSRLPLAVPGAEEMLSYIHSKYDVNVLSNGFKGVQQRKLASSGLDKYIHQVVLSDDCGITKPLRGIFDYALDRCHATAQKSVMIGDNYETDICGAHDAGWHTIYFNADAAQGNYPSADAMVTSLAQIMDIL